MKTRIVSLLAVLLATTLTVLPGGQDTGPPREGVATLWVQDDLLSSFDFHTGTGGGTLRAGEVDLARAQIAYGVFEHGMLSYGFDAEAYATVLDLGRAFVEPNRRGRDRSPELSTSVVHTLRIDRSQVSYTGADGTLERFPAANAIFATLPPQGPYHVEPEVGNTYLLRTRARDVGAADAFFAFVVLDVEPGRWLTIRWRRIDLR